MEKHRMRSYQRELGWSTAAIRAPPTGRIDGDHRGVLGVHGPVDHLPDVARGELRAVAAAFLGHSVEAFGGAADVDADDDWQGMRIGNRARTTGCHAHRSLAKVRLRILHCAAHGPHPF